MSYDEEKLCTEQVNSLLRELEENREWAEANIWEVPITLPDHLQAAQDTIEALLLRQRMPPAQTAICREALDQYGIRAQTMMVFEEMAELQKELCKRSRGADNKENIAEEIADVLIMLEQMILAYNCAGMVKVQIEGKLHRLKKRLKDKNEQEVFQA